MLGGDSKSSMAGVAGAEARVFFGLGLGWDWDWGSKRRSNETRSAFATAES